MPTDEALLEKILAEPATLQIASSLGMDPEDYAKRVLFFLRNPKADVQLKVMSPEQEKAEGVPSIEEALAFVDGMISGDIPVGDEHTLTRFAGSDKGEKKSVQAAGGSTKRGPQKAPPMPGDPPRR